LLLNFEFRSDTEFCLAGFCFISQNSALQKFRRTSKILKRNFKKRGQILKAEFNELH